MSEQENQLTNDQPAPPPEIEIDEGHEQAQETENQSTETETQEKPPEKQYSRNSVHKRFDQLTAQRREAERQAEQLKQQLLDRETELARIRAGGEPGKAEPKIEDPNTIAERIASAKLMNQRADEIYQKGMSAHPDFEDKCAGLRSFGCMTPELIEAVSDEPNAHEIIAFLGNDIERAQIVAKMTGARLGRELAKIEAEMSKPPIVSKAPAPTKPISGANTRTDVDLSKLSMREFDEVMTKREAAYRASKR